MQAVSLGKDTLEGVESLKELSQELEQKKEVAKVYCLFLIISSESVISATSYSVADWVKTIPLC